MLDEIGKCAPSFEHRAHVYLGNRRVFCQDVAPRDVALPYILDELASGLRIAGVEFVEAAVDTVVLLDDFPVRTTDFLVEFYQVVAIVELFVVVACFQVVPLGGLRLQSVDAHPNQEFHRLLNAHVAAANKRPLVDGVEDRFRLEHRREIIVLESGVFVSALNISSLVFKGSQVLVEHRVFSHRFQSKGSKHLT